MGIKRILTSDIEDLFTSDQKLFFKAVRQGNIEEVKYLLTKKIDINAALPDDYNSDLTPLSYACINKPKIADLLLDAGADFTIKEYYNNTALLTAARYGRAELVKKMIEKGADINIYNREGDTPLTRALIHGRFKTAQILLQAGADTSNINELGNNALLLAASAGMTPIVEDLIKIGKFDINRTNQKGDTALTLAVNNGKTDTVLTLIKAGAKINTINNSGNNALMLATARGDTAIVETLINAGATLDAVNGDGQSALSLAKKHKCFGIELKLEKALGLLPQEKAPAEPLAKQEQNSKLQSPCDKWLIAGEDRIAFIGTYPDINLKITEIYNFAAREKMIISEDLDSGSKTPPTLASFNQLAQPAIEKALNEFEAQGGKAERNFVLHGKSMIKGKPAKNNKVA